jgi:hypothetical protein
MNGQSTSREPIHCYACQNQTNERCSYCHLPLCAEHGRQVQPWFTSRVVMVCTPCQAILEDIARQELMASKPTAACCCLAHSYEREIMMVLCLETTGL